MKIRSSVNLIDYRKKSFDEIGEIFLSKDTEGLINKIEEMYRVIKYVSLLNLKKNQWNVWNLNKKQCLYMDAIKADIDYNALNVVDIKDKTSAYILNNRGFYPDSITRLIAKFLANALIEGNQKLYEFIFNLFGESFSRSSKFLIKEFFYYNKINSGIRWEKLDIKNVKVIIKKNELEKFVFMNHIFRKEEKEFRNFWEKVVAYIIEKTNIKKSPRLLANTIELIVNLWKLGYKDLSLGLTWFIINSISMEDTYFNLLYYKSVPFMSIRPDIMVDFFFILKATISIYKDEEKDMPLYVLEKIYSVIYSFVDENLSFLPNPMIPYISEYPDLPFILDKRFLKNRVGLIHSIRFFMKIYQKDRNKFEEIIKYSPGQRSFSLLIYTLLLSSINDKEEIDKILKEMSFFANIPKITTSRIKTDTIYKIFSEILSYLYNNIYSDKIVSVVAYLNKDYECFLFYLENYLKNTTEEKINVLYEVVAYLLKQRNPDIKNIIRVLSIFYDYVNYKDFILVVYKVISEIEDDIDSLTSFIEEVFRVFGENVFQNDLFYMKLFNLKKKYKDEINFYFIDKIYKDMIFDIYKGNINQSILEKKRYKKLSSIMEAFEELSYDLKKYDISYKLDGNYSLLWNSIIRKESVTEKLFYLSLIKNGYVDDRNFHALLKRIPLQKKLRFDYMHYKMIDIIMDKFVNESDSEDLINILSNYTQYPWILRKFYKKIMKSYLNGTVYFDRTYSFLKREINEKTPYLLVFDKNVDVLGFVKNLNMEDKKEFDYMLLLLDGLYYFSDIVDVQFNKIFSYVNKKVNKNMLRTIHEDVGYVTSILKYIDILIRVKNYKYLEKTLDNFVNAFKGEVTRETYHKNSRDVRIWNDSFNSLFISLINQFNESNRTFIEFVTENMLSVPFVLYPPYMALMGAFLGLLPEDTIKKVSFSEKIDFLIYIANIIEDERIKNRYEENVKRMMPYILDDAEMNNSWNDIVNINTVKSVWNFVPDYVVAWNDLRQF